MSQLYWTELWNFLTPDHINVLCPNLGAPISKLTNQPTYLPTYLPSYLPTYLTTYLPTYLTIYLLTYLPTYLTTYLSTYLLTNSMDQSSFWEANTSAGSQYIPHVSWASKFHCRVNNSMLLFRTESQINPVHALSKYFLKIHFNITLPSASRFSKLSLSLRVSHQISYTNPLTCHMRQMEQYDSSFIHINRMSHNTSRLPRIAKTAVSEDPVHS
jgi:hypothetical protein